VSAVNNAIQDEIRYLTQTPNSGIGGRGVEMEIPVSGNNTYNLEVEVILIGD